MLAGCGEKGGASPKSAVKGAKAKGAAAPVLVGQVQRQRIPIIVEAVGAVEPLRMTAVRPQVTGVLQKIAFQEGKDVKQGDLLFEIDPRPFRGALQAATADLQKLKVQLETARAQVARYEALSRDQMISKEHFQKILDEALTTEAEVLASESRVNNAKLQLEFSAMRAPMSGRTGNLNVHEGDLIRANDPGSLVTINQVSPVYVTFGVPQQYLSAINRYRAERSLAVRVIPPGSEETPESGELTFLDNMVDPATGTIKLKATFKNEHQRLWPGQFASVMITLAEPEVLTVAASAVQNSQTGQHVFVISPDRIAELRPITVGRTYEGFAVVTKGLEEGESVVIDGQIRVIPGRSVEIKAPPGSSVSETPPSETAQGKKKAKTVEKSST
jgi:multidrug efflux system membrane fusion protein